MDILSSLKGIASSTPTTVLAASENLVPASHADEVTVVIETMGSRRSAEILPARCRGPKEIQIGSKHCGRKMNISINKNPGPIRIRARKNRNILGHIQSPED
jgi:hypothetical protein